MGWFWDGWQRVLVLGWAFDLSAWWAAGRWRWGCSCRDARLVWVGGGGEGRDPWWHISSGARPTYLHAGAARDEVQELKVNGTGGDVLWVEPVALEHRGFECLSVAPKCFGVFPYNALATEVQTSLEAIYGAGNVEVSGGPTQTGQSVVTELEPYVIKFMNKLASQQVSLPSSNFLGSAGSLGGSNLEGTASVTQATKGRPDGEIVASVYNLGDASAFGGVSPVRVTDTLPAGLKALAVAGPSCEVESESAAGCSFEGVLPPFGVIEVRIAVEVTGAISGANGVSVSGGEGFVCAAQPGGKFTDGACRNEGESGGFERQVTGPIEAAQVSRPVTASAEQTPFGLQEYELADEEESGAVDTQAGSHQFQSTFSVMVNQLADENPPPSSEKEGEPEVNPAALAKDLNFKLPPGWIGNPVAFPTCSIGDFQKKVHEHDECPADTAVGVATVTYLEPAGNLGERTLRVPVFTSNRSRGSPRGSASLSRKSSPVCSSTPRCAAAATTGSPAKCTTSPRRGGSSPAR